MRIIAQLVPDGQPISTDIEATRQPGINTWELPAWGRPLALGVYPCFITKNRSLIPVGTTFCISKLGISLTALHNIREAVRHHLNEDFPGKMESLPDHSAGKDIGMAVFHHKVLHGKSFSGNMLNVTFIAASPTTDVCYLSPQFQSGSPYLPLPISLAIPRIGSRVVCAGFSDLSVQNGSLSQDDIQGGRVNLLEMYKHKFLAVEGRVTRIFTRRFADGFIGGPCFTINAAINHGMIGGPVFSENGYVCGVVSAGATNFLDEPASIVSLLYPALVMNIKFERQTGPVRVKSNLRLTDLIAQGTVITDGTEKLITIDQEGGASSLNPAFHGEDADYLFDDFASFQERRRTARK